MKIGKDWQKKPWAANAIALCCAVVLYVVLSHLDLLLKALKGIYYFIEPVFIGLVIAYVLDPMVKFFERTILIKVRKRKAARAVGVLLTFAIIIVAIAVLLVALIPQLISSIRMFISNLSIYSKSLNDLLAQLTDYAAQHNVDISNITSMGNDLIQSITDWLPKSVNSILDKTISVGVNIFNLVISSIIAIYFLFDKRTMLAGAKHLQKALLGEKSYQASSNFLGKCNTILTRYILSDLVDGLIIGCANAVFMIIGGLPYVPLISVVVGVTNLLPTFGPILGAVIGGVILVLINPWYALAFLLFTICLQTLDGYVIKPKLFGNTLGVPSIWILSSIIVGGRMFGVVGVLLGIPAAAILDFLYHKEFLPWLERRHRRDKKKSADAAGAAGGTEGSAPEQAVETD